MDEKQKENKDEKADSYVQDKTFIIEKIWLSLSRTTSIQVLSITVFAEIIYVKYLIISL